MHHAAWRLQRLGAGGKALLRQQRRHQPGAGCATGVKRLGHAAKLFAHANRLRGGNAQRHGGLRLGQAQEARAACRRAHRAGRTGDVPAPVVVVRVHGIAHAAGHIDAQHQRVHQRAPAGAGVLGQRQQRRGHRPGRVDDGFEVSVVKVKSVRADAIEQGRAGHVYFVAAAQHAGLGRRLQQAHRRKCGLHRLVLRRADGAAQPVEKSAVRGMVHCVGPTARGMGGHKMRQQLGDGRGVVVGGDLGIAGHGGKLSLNFGDAGLSLPAEYCVPWPVASSGRCQL